MWCGAEGRALSPGSSSGSDPYLGPVSLHCCGSLRRVQVTAVQWVHLFPALNSQFSHRSPDIGHGGSRYTLDSANASNQAPACTPSQDSVVNIYQHTTEGICLAKLCPQSPESSGSEYRSPGLHCRPLKSGSSGPLGDSKDLYTRHWFSDEWQN